MIHGKLFTLKHSCYQGCGSSSHFEICLIWLAYDSPLCENMSSTKLIVHNVLHCGQISTKPRPQATCTENLKYGLVVFSARCNICISRLCYDVKCPSVCPSVCLSVTEVHWRIIANLGFRSKFTVHCGRRRGNLNKNISPLLGPLVEIYLQTDRQKDMLMTLLYTSTRNDIINTYRHRQYYTTNNMSLETAII